ncbi:MAG: MATE family efflux transporter [Planctomycetota bacterium]
MSAGGAPTTKGPRVPRPGEIRSGRLAGLSMWAAIWVLSWPTLIESLLTALVGFVDTALAARMSAAATDAIGLTAYFGWLFSLVGMAVGTGVVALVARAMGRGRTAVANAALGQAALLAVAAGGTTGAIVYAFAPAIAGAFLKSPEAQDLAVEYLRVIAIGIPAQAFVAAALSALRGAGDAIRPLTVMAGVNVINVLVSFALAGVSLTVVGVGDSGEIVERVLIPKPFAGIEPNVGGIAWGTTVAWWVATAVLVAMLSRGVSGLRLRVIRLRPHWHTTRRILRVGIPSFAETAGMWFGNLIVIIAIRMMEAPNLMGAHIIAIRAEAFSFLPGFAMGTAAATLAGQYLGAGRVDLATQAITRCVLLATLLMGLFGWAFILIPETIVRVFSAQPEHLLLVPPLLVMMGLFQAPFGASMALRGALRGAGDTTIVMFITWGSTYLIRLPLVWLCSGVEIPLWGDVVIPNPAPVQAWLGVTQLQGLWIALGLELCIRPVFFLARFLQGGWKHVKV